MINKNIDALTNDYISIVSQYDYKLGKETNKIYKQEKQIMYEINKFNPDELKYFLDIVLSHESLNVQLSAAAIAIENQYKADEAKKIILSIRAMTVIEAKSNAPLFALLTEHLFDDNYPYINDIYHKTSALMKESFLKDSVHMKKRNKIVMIISEFDENLIKKYIDFLNNRKHDGSFLYYGALLAFKYNYHIEDARNNLNKISNNNLNWGKTSRFCLDLLNELDNPT